MRHLILLASTCPDGDCPSIWTDPETGDVIVRGPDDQDVTRERDVRFTKATWQSMLRQL